MQSIPNGYELVEPPVDVSCLDSILSGDCGGRGVLGIEAENKNFPSNDITNPKIYATRMYQYETGIRYSYL